MSVKYTLNILGYRRVEQGGLGSQKRELVPRREKAEAQCKDFIHLLPVTCRMYLEDLYCKWFYS